MAPDPLRGRLPGYAWDTRMRGGGQYRHVLADGRLGKLVSQKEIVTNLRTIHDASAVRFGNLAADAVNGAITPTDFQLTMAGELRSLYNGSSALARGGWSQMGPAEWGRNGQVLKGEYRFLAGFAQDIADGKLSTGQAQARAALYSGKAYSRFWDEDQQKRQAAGDVTEERWDDTGDSRECHDCEVLAQMGWVSIGAHDTVPGAGDTVCGGACRCELVYR